MSNQYTVVYDSCVLYSMPLRNVLMYLALTDLFRARWTNMIHDEWIQNLREKRPELDPERLERTRELMNRHIRGCLVEGFEELIPNISLPDPDDRHIVAAVIRCGAQSIVTINLKDFPDEALFQYDIRAIFLSCLCGSERVIGGNVNLTTFLSCLCGSERDS